MGLADRADETIKQAESWMTSQRWYGDKARSVESLTPYAVQPVNIDALDAALVIVHFSYERGTDSRYFVPMVTKGVPVSGDLPEIHDALIEQKFLGWLIDGFRDDRRVDGDVRWLWHRLGDEFPDISTRDASKARIISAEQSNTSIVFGNQLICKVFRRLHPGVNPDLEISGFLSTDNRFAHVPKLYGVIEIEDKDGITAVAAMQEFVPNKGDGWGWLLNELESLSSDSIPALVDAVSLLGTRTAEMHVALASDASSEDFAPEEFTADDADALIKRVIAEMAESVEGLAKRLNPAEVEQLHKGIGSLMAGAWSLVGDHKTRVHGDYHLGQTLRSVTDDFVLIDFEGEPSRPMDQRRMKQSPLKDVAGMLRSLDYAAATVTNSTQDSEVKQAIMDWLPLATAAFENAYRRRASAASVRLIPSESRKFREGLNLLIAEKALYEVRYELNNRPDWLAIPLNGIRRLAGIPVTSQS